jgi:DDE_Tnp_1-associated
MAVPATSLLDAFAQIDDPRQARGIRHPYASILALAFLGLLGRQVDMASLQRWAQDHWHGLKKPLGFDRKEPPHATTISRALSRFSLEPFRDPFARRIVTLPRAADAADGETSKQGHDAHGDPVPMLNVFAHEVGLGLARFPVAGGKPTEPPALEAGLAGLIEHYPFLRRSTGDALFRQGPPARVTLEADRDFLSAVKDNQPDLPGAILTSFLDAESRIEVDVAARAERPSRSGSTSLARAMASGPRVARSKSSE